MLYIYLLMMAISGGLIGWRHRRRIVPTLRIIRLWLGFAMWVIWRAMRRLGFYLWSAIRYLLRSLRTVLGLFLSDPIQLLGALLLSGGVGAMVMLPFYVISAFTDAVIWYVYVAAVVGCLLGFVAYYAYNQRTVPTTKALAVERLGGSRLIHFAGPRILFFAGFFDFVKSEVDLKPVQVLVFPIDAMLDFKKGKRRARAHVPVKVWLEINHGRNEVEYRENIERAVWAFPDPIERVRNILAGLLRPALQGMDMDEAQKAEVRSMLEGALTGHALRAVRSGLFTVPVLREAFRAIAETGYRIRTEEGLTIDDFDEPAEMQEINLIKIRAEEMAKATGYRSTAIAASVKKYIKAGAPPKEAASLAAADVTAQGFIMMGAGTTVEVEVRPNRKNRR